MNRGPPGFKVHHLTPKQLQCCNAISQPCDCSSTFTTGSTGGEPPNWNDDCDTLLAKAFLSPNVNINSFKRAVYSVDPKASDAASVDPSTYDLSFVHDRLEELLGKCLCRTRMQNNIHMGGEQAHFHKSWLRLSWEKGDGARLYCSECMMLPPAIYMNRHTKIYRCGECGNLELSRVFTLIEILDGNIPTEKRFILSQKSIHRDPTSFLDVLSVRGGNEMPSFWKKFPGFDSYLKKSYLDHPTDFDVDDFKQSIERIDSSLGIQLSLFDIGFLHDRLEAICGPCICRRKLESDLTLDLDNAGDYLHREWGRVYFDDDVKLLFCDACKVVPPRIYASNGVPDILRCGACGSEDINRTMCDVQYYSLQIHLVKQEEQTDDIRRLAGAPPRDRRRVVAKLQKLMRLFDDVRPDKPVDADQG